MGDRPRQLVALLSPVELDQCSAALRFVINIGQRVNGLVDAAEFDVFRQTLNGTRFRGRGKSRQCLNPARRHTTRRSYVNTERTHFINAPECSYQFGRAPPVRSLAEAIEQRL